MTRRPPELDPLNHVLPRRRKMIDAQGTPRCDAEIGRRFDNGEYTCAAPAKWKATMSWKGPRRLDYCDRHIHRAGDDRYTIGRLLRKERI